MAQLSGKGHGLILKVHHFLLLLPMCELLFYLFLASSHKKKNLFSEVMVGASCFLVENTEYTSALTGAFCVLCPSY